jgi:hypothetical protein
MPVYSKTTLFLAIPGTRETRELDLETVRHGVARGEIPLDNWAWSPQQNAWLPLSQLPEFSQVAPVPFTAAPVRVEPKKVEPVKVAVPAVQVRMPAVAVASTNHMATYYSKPVEEPREFPVFKVLFFVLGMVSAALVVANYFLIEQPFRTEMARTRFASVQAHAHLGAFVQPNALLIHILPSRDINPDNFADLLAALTQAAPHQAIAGFPFSTVSLTSAWRGQYTLPIDAWSGLAGMSGDSPEQKKLYVLSHLESIEGEPLLRVPKNEDPAQLQTREDKAWKELVAHFQSS